MKPLLKLFVAFCLVNFAFSRPFPYPEGDEGAADGEEDQPEDAGEEDAGGEEAGDDAEGEDAGGDDAGGDDAEQEDAGSEDAGGDEESSPKSGGGNGEAKDDRANTYNKVVEQLDKSTKVDQIESAYLRPALDNDLQAGIRNPIIDAIGTIGDYSKISSCFSSMDSDVKKVLDEEVKSFKACMSKKDASEYTCSEESSNKAKGKFTEIGSKIVSCVSSKGN